MLFRLLLLLSVGITPSTFGADRVCAEIGTTCSSGPGALTVDGMTITRPCTARSTHFACIDLAAHDTCEPLRQRGCQPGPVQCLEKARVAGTSLCMEERHEYACRSGGGTTSTVADCAGQQYCIEGKCFDAGSASDRDFQHVIASLETAREAGVYLDQDTLQVFRGEDRRCGKNVARNCCRSSGRDIDRLSNRSVQGGSPHVYDVLSGSGVPSTLAANIDPTGYALDASRDVVRDMLQCEQDEVLTAVRRSKGLCHYVGDYCSRKLRVGPLQLCVEHKETHCCFNSKIARLVAQAARQQLPGLDWGTPDRPRCDGITVDQLQRLDLSRIDFSEVYDDIRPAQHDPSGAARARTTPYFDHR